MGLARLQVSKLDADCVTIDKGVASNAHPTYRAPFVVIGEGADAK